MNKQIVVKISTLEEEKELLTAFQDKGMVWYGGDKPLNQTVLDLEDDGAIIGIELDNEFGYNTIDDFEYWKEDYRIVSLKEALKILKGLELVATEYELLPIKK